MVYITYLALSAPMSFISYCPGPGTFNLGAMLLVLGRILYEMFEKVELLV